MIMWKEEEKNNLEIPFFIVFPLPSFAAYYFRIHLQPLDLCLFHKFKDKDPKALWRSQNLHTIQS